MDNTREPARTASMSSLVNKVLPRGVTSDCQSARTSSTVCTAHSVVGVQIPLAHRCPTAAGLVGADVAGTPVVVILELSVSRNILRDEQTECGSHMHTKTNLCHR